MMSKTPAVEKLRWECRDERDQKHLEDWTNDQLDAEVDAADAAADATYNPAHDPFHIFHPTVAVLEQDIAQRWKRRRVIVARNALTSKTSTTKTKERAREILKRLADTEELRQLAFEKREPGRAKGEHRPRKKTTNGQFVGDHSEATRWCLEEALADVEHIRRIWKREFGKRNRAASPTALEIAARRYGIEDTALINFKKNRRRQNRHRHSS